MPSRRRIARNVLVAAALLIGCACAADRAAGQRTPLAPGGWQSPLHRDHPLVGKVWNVRASGWATTDALHDAVALAHFVLLGEAHDNADHHLLEADLLRAIARTGRRPSLAFELLQSDQQGALNGALVGTGPRADAVAEALHWRDSGWPEFAMFRPLFDAGIDAGFPLVCADLPRERQENFVRTGISWFPRNVRRLLAAEQPSDDARNAARSELQRAHCGGMPEKLLDRIVLLQRARDAAMADRLLSIDGEISPPGYEQGAILVAGTEHVRRDRAIAEHLAREAPTRDAVVVAFLEVSAEETTPHAYATRFGTGPLPFDFVVFTPAVARPARCGEPPKGRPDEPSTTVALFEPVRAR